MANNMFSHEARVFKFDVLVDICRKGFEKPVDEDEIQADARKLVSMDTPRVRCCVYKEREVLRQRVRLAMGKMANDEREYKPTQIVQVIDAACDGCTIKKIRVTDNCRSCMAKACVAACRFGAMHIGTERSEIDYSKCKECGACARACPYNAIVITERPCYAHCPVQAISWDAHGLARIDESKCINCGQCEGACPFGAVEDMSWILPAVNDIREGKDVYAIVAPSIQGQFDDCTLPQIMKSVEMIGFKECIEVAVGADAVADVEYKELKEHKEAGKVLTTSCCPAFVNMLKIHFPQQYKENKSSTMSPMLATAAKVKAEHPDAKIAFIGPCICKKQEVQDAESAVDYALTYEELAAMMIGRGINPSDAVPDKKNIPSNYGRNFAHSGGVAAAVMEAAKEQGDGPYTAVNANGAFECKKQIQLLKFGKLNADILEGMCCEGGCINGPAGIAEANLVRGRMAKENIPNSARQIRQSLDEFEMRGFDISLHNKDKA